MTSIEWQQLPAFFEAVAEVFTEKKDELCDMDAHMGDGDLGLTMHKGYGALPGLIRENAQEGDIGKTLMKAGMKMASVVPSTMGTLMGSGIMEGGKALKGQERMDASGLCAFLTGFATGIAKRGKCQLGDRTILDAMDAAAKGADAAQKEGAQDLGTVIDAALKGAQDGVEATRQMTPKFGKAAVFAAKAIGIPDQGAVAGEYLILGMQRYIHQNA